MSAQAASDRSAVVMKAFKNATKALGMSHEKAAKVLGKSRLTLERKAGFAEDAKEYELQVLFIRAYRSLYALMGGDENAMLHWFTTRNKHLNGIPAELVMRATGLVGINEYLDAMRAKV